MAEQKRSGRITQKRIAELAGVSQATVSLVLNGKEDGTNRIPEATRQRVLDVIRGSEYVADPAARRLAGVGNKIFGVFTYEPAFPKDNADFYTPLLQGIESAAEQIGVDLLLSTSTPVVDGRRQLLHEGNRIRLSDGCLLLGRRMDRDELSRLLASGFPFVAIGRREEPKVPFVGIDYRSATASLANRAIDLGHRRFAYVYTDIDTDVESAVDRRNGVEDAVNAHADVELSEIAWQLNDPAGLWAALMASRPTVLFVESMEHAACLRILATSAGLSVPGDLSMVVLSDALRDNDSTTDFTRLSPPRGELGSAAVHLLARILDADDDVPEADLETLLDCPTIDGRTLAAAPEERVP